MQVGIDSFAAFDDAGLSLNPSERLRRLVEQIEYADKIGLDVCLELVNIIVESFLIQLLLSFWLLQLHEQNEYVLRVL
jgi:hypothetical protein